MKTLNVFVALAALDGGGGSGSSGSGDAGTPHPPNSPSHVIDNITKQATPLPPHSENQLYNSDSLTVPSYAHSLLADFEKLVVRIKLVGGQEGPRLTQALSHWRKAQAFMAAVPLLPGFWSFQPELFYLKAAEFGLHPAYWDKVRLMLNEFGRYYCMTAGQPFGEIKAARGQYKQRIIEGAAARTGKVSHAAKPLTPSVLRAAKAKMSEPHYNFLFVCAVLGLRPSELEGLKNKKLRRHVKNGTEHYLDVYQGKLTAIEDARRWKRIPIVGRSMHVALNIIEAGSFARPDRRTIKKELGKNYGAYSPRKGFAMRMLRLGWELEDVRDFLGHKNIETTKGYYIDHEKLMAHNAKRSVERLRAKRRVESGIVSAQSSVKKEEV